MERQDDDRKFSFSYDVGGEKLRLIDVSKEDDFLIDSPLFDSLEDLRLSVAFDGTNEHTTIGSFGPQSCQEGNNTGETSLQKEENLSSSGSVEPARPSYVRRSLAWDSAFFNSAGVLDLDELAFINRGLKAVEDIPMRRAEAKSMCGLMKIDNGHRDKVDKIKTKRSSQRHIIQSSENTRIKMKHDPRKEGASCKHSKTSERMEDLLRTQGMSSSSNKYDTAIENKAAIRLGKDIMLRKKSAFLNSSSLPSGRLSSPMLSSAVSISTNENTGTLSPDNNSLSRSSRKVPSAVVKGKAVSQKGKLWASTSRYGTPSRLIKNNKELGCRRLSILSGSIPNTQTCLSPRSSSDVSLSTSTSRTKQQPDEIEVHLGTPVVWREGLQTDGFLGPPNTPHISHRQSSLSLQYEEVKSPAEMKVETVVGVCTISTPRKKFKTSGLRQPSPTIGFFDEDNAKASGGLQFQYEAENTLPHDYGPITRKRSAKLLLDDTSPKTKSFKHSFESHQLQSTPGIRGRNTSPDKRFWNPCSRISSKIKSLSDRALRRCTPKFVGTEEGICYKSRKVNTQDFDRKRACRTSVLKGEDDQRQVEGKLRKALGLQNKGGQRDDMRVQGRHRNQSTENKIKSRKTISGDLHLLNEERIVPSNLEDQVNDLSRYFDIIDLSKDMVTEFKGEGNKDPDNPHNVDDRTEKISNNISSFFDRKSILHDQARELPKISPNPNQFSLSLSGSLSSSRTPLANRNSICNQSGSVKSPGELTKGKLLVKSLVCSPEGIDKENI